MITNRTDINSVLSQMREMRAQMQARQPTSPVRESQMATPSEATAPTAPSFGKMFSEAINKVAETQQTAGNLSRSFEQGDPGVSLTQVMVATQKASVSFQAMTQVRNKLIDAYQEVMNMQV